MKRQTLRDAYRAFHAEQKKLCDRRRRAAELEAKVSEALTFTYVERLRNDKAFNRTLDRFTGHTAHGWSCACGCDGRLRGLLRMPGWAILEEVIKKIRHERGIGRHYWRSGRDPSMTVTIQIGGA